MSNTNILNVIKTLIDEHRNLSEKEAYLIMQEIMQGSVSDKLVSSLLTILTYKGESVSELVGMNKAMQEACLNVGDVPFPLLDTCGTGGAKVKTFNVSTAAAFIAAAGGASVAKHGNRAMTSSSGSADFLEALGANISLEPLMVSKCINETGIGFMFAQNFHPAMKYVSGVRKELGFRTIFNLLGPLTNPARANCRILGTSSPKVAKKMAEALLNLNMRHALVVCGEEEIDEISVSGNTLVYEIRNKKLNEFILNPQDYGIQKYKITQLLSSTPEENAQKFRDILSGNGESALHDFIVMNAGPALYVTGVASSIKDGIRIAEEAIDNGDAASKVAAFIEVTKKLSKK
jgi:anthranilate phosphoribosyltransferase